MAVAVISAGSSGVDTGWLGIVWELVVIDQLRQPQRNLEIGADRAPPGLLDRESQRTPDGVDIVVQGLGHLSPFDAPRERRVRNSASVVRKPHANGELVLTP
jgi:hypothetical protein